MAARLRRILASPIFGAFLAVLALAAGAALGLVASEAIRAAEIKRQAERAASHAPAQPQRTPLPPEQDKPFEPHDVEFGPEIVCALDQRGRALLIDIGLVTMRGESAARALEERRIPLRALAAALVSDWTVERAQAPGAAQDLAARLQDEFNAFLRPSVGASLVDRVVIKRFFLQ